MEKGSEAGTEGAIEVTGYTGNCRGNPPEAEATDEVTVEGTNEATPEEIEEAREGATPEATDGHPRTDPEATEVETDGTPHPGTTDKSRPITVAPEPDDATAEGTVPDDETTAGRLNKDSKNGTNESPSRDDPGVGDPGSHTHR